MRIKKLTVKKFIERAIQLDACDEGLALFKNKKGTVIQRIRKMCEIANRTFVYGRRNDGRYNHRSALDWLVTHQTDFDDLGFELLDYNITLDGVRIFRVEITND